MFSSQDTNNDDTALDCYALLVSPRRTVRSSIFSFLMEKLGHIFCRMSYILDLSDGFHLLTVLFLQFLSSLSFLHKTR